MGSCDPVSCGQTSQVRGAFSASLDGVPRSSTAVIGLDIKYSKAALRQSEQFVRTKWKSGGKLSVELNGRVPRARAPAPPKLSVNGVSPFSLDPTPREVE